MQLHQLCRDGGPQQHHAAPAGGGAHALGHHPAPASTGGSPGWGWRRRRWQWEWEWERGQWGEPRGGYGAAIGGGGGGGDDDRNLTPAQRIVFDIFKEAEGVENGLHQDEAIKRGKAKGLSGDAITAAITSLQMDGLIYSTVDDQHFM